MRERLVLTSYCKEEDLLFCIYPTKISSSLFDFLRLPYFSRYAVFEEKVERWRFYYLCSTLNYFVKMPPDDGMTAPDHIDLSQWQSCRATRAAARDWLIFLPFKVDIYRNW